jgi:tape measure domain-containing protein
MADKDVNYRLTLTDLLSGKLREAENEADKLEGKLSGVQAMIGTAFAAAATYGVGAFVNSMVEAGTKVEDARVGLGTLLKDTEEAGRVIENTMEDATKTPFAFEGLLAANKALIGAGETAEKSRVNVLNLANAIAATGGGDDELNRMVVNLQQIKNVGEATAMDIKQFAMAGVNIYQVLADATGKPIEKVKEMKVSYELLTDALAKAHEAGGIYEGGLEKMAANTSVQISNLGDAMFQLKVKMFDDLKPAITWFIGAAKETADALRDGWDWLVANKDEVKAVAAGVGTAAAAYLLYNTYLKAAVVWQGIMNAKTAAGVVINELLLGWELARAEGLGVLASAQWALNVAMNANPIGLVIAGVAALGAILYYAWEKSEVFRGAVMGMWEATKVAVSQIVQAFKGMYHVIAGTILFDPEMVNQGINEVTDVVLNGYKKVGAAAVNGYNDGVASKRAEDATGKSGKKTAQPGTAKSGKATSAPAEATSANKASGTKSVTMTIHINKLIDKFEINTNKITESYGKITEHVANAMLQAANDASLHSEI